MSGPQIHDEPWTDYNDLTAVVAVLKAMGSLYVPSDCSIAGGTIEIRNKDYPVGWLWFDPEAEDWRYAAYRDGVES